MELIIKKRTTLIYVIFSIFAIGTIGCESFVEVDPPKNSVVSETVFEDSATVESALANIYVKMRQQGLVSGNFSLSISMGIYADELDYFGTTPDILKLYGHNVLASDGKVLVWWNHAYNLIYAANDIIEGVGNSPLLNDEDKNWFIGQALFVRAYIHSLLVSLYGDVPYITTTDYTKNNSASRLPVNEVYQKMIDDLNNASSLLLGIETGGNHILPSQEAVNALLARLYLYSENWAMAETMSTKLIDNFQLEAIDNVFLKGSSETIWQLELGDNPVNTYDALQLIISAIPTQGVALTDDLITAFETGDLRYTSWTESITSSDGLTILNYAHKYKATHNTTTISEEYPIIFRLGEQYLIRAEARIHLGNIIGAEEDINTIRNRAGLGNTMANDKTTLLEAILHERRIELFTEQGHRWFDLKRTEKASEVLSLLKAGWRNTDLLLPIPESELGLNSNLLPQNSGY